MHSNGQSRGNSSERHDSQNTSPQQQTYMPPSNVYCERFNTSGHLSRACTAPAVDPNCTLWCAHWLNRVHLIEACNHPNACLRCRRPGHTPANCTKPGCIGEELRVWHMKCVKDKATREQWLSIDWAPQWLATHKVMDGHAPSTSRFTPLHASKTWISTSSAQPYQISTKHPQQQSVEDELRRSIQDDLDKYEAGVRLLIAQRSDHSRKIVNDHIQYIAGIVYAKGINDPVVPHLDLSATENEKMRVLLQVLHLKCALIQACLYIQNGWTFFHDPQPLDALFKKQVPICSGCQSEGLIRDCTFTPIPEDQNLPDVADWLDWGTICSFNCSCAKQCSYTYESRKSDPMEIG